MNVDKENVAGVWIDVASKTYISIELARQKIIVDGLKRVFTCGEIDEFIDNELREYRRRGCTELEETVQRVIDFYKKAYDDTWNSNSGLGI